MATQSWGQVTTAVPACVPMALEVCGSLLEAVTVVITLSRPPASATQDIKVKRSLQEYSKTTVLWDSYKDSSAVVSFANAAGWFKTK